MGRRKLPRVKKICPTCKKEFELARWVLHSFCSRACANFVRRENPVGRVCRVCKTPQPLENFYTKTPRKDGSLRHESVCKDCKNAAICRRYASDLAYRDRHDKNTRKWRQNNADANNDNQRSRSMRVKLETIIAYGGECKCCGETNFEFLTVDHIYGGGNKQRKALKRAGGHTFYEWLKAQGFPRDLYRLLCFNCNTSYGFWGYCPHQKRLEVVA
jgi:hypothetical protein